MRQFVSHGYDLNDEGTPKEGALLNFCPLNAKSRNDCIGLIVLLLELGADPNLYPTEAQSNVKQAILPDHASLVELLIRHESFDPDRVDGGGRSALHHLASSGKMPLLELFLEYRQAVDLNVQDRLGVTALHLAVDRGNLDMVRYLLQMPDIRIDLPDKRGRTPLALATWWGLSKMALIFIERSEAFPTSQGGQASVILSSARQGQKDVTSRLLSRVDSSGIERETDESGKAFLHHATMNNWHVIIASCLELNPGINVNHIDHSGGTALHYGAKLGCTESCEVLLRHAASTRLQDRNGRNAAQMAAEAGFKDTLMLVVKQGKVDANQRDHFGRNLVHWTATLDCVDVMTLVCSQVGVEVARRDNAGKMPVDYAWSCQCPQVGRYLSLRTLNTALEPPWEDPYSWDVVYYEAAARFKEMQNVTEALLQASHKTNAEAKRDTELYPPCERALVSTGQLLHEEEERRNRHGYHHPGEPFYP